MEIHHENRQRSCHQLLERSGAHPFQHLGIQETLSMDLFIRKAPKDQIRIFTLEPVVPLSEWCLVHPRLEVSTRKPTFMRGRATRILMAPPYHLRPLYSTASAAGQVKQHLRLHRPSQPANHSKETTRETSRPPRSSAGSTLLQNPKARILEHLGTG
jgi:hypothetical protein